MAVETVAPVLRSVTVECAPEHAFRVFTERLGEWWPLETHSIYGGDVDERVLRARRGRADRRALEGGRGVELGRDPRLGAARPGRVHLAPGQRAGRAEHRGRAPLRRRRRGDPRGARAPRLGGSRQARGDAQRLRAGLAGRARPLRRCDSRLTGAAEKPKDEAAPALIPGRAPVVKIGYRMSAVTELRDVILRDGTTLRLRPPHSADSEALLEFFAGLSERSRYLRFHGLPELGRGLVEPWVEPNWTDIGALIGALGDPGEERVVALASYARLREPHTAEVAFAVADDLQGRGVGTRLLEQLAALAGEAGIERFVAVVMPENRPMLAVFEDAGFKVARALEGGEIEVRFPIAATATYQEAVDERDHVGVTASLLPFFRPASVAVIGASRRRGSIGGELFRNILEADFSGAAFPINVKGEPVAGVRAYTKIGEIPDEIDLAVICLPGERVLDAAEEALQKGVRALCVISAGFAEIGRRGNRAPGPAPRAGPRARRPHRRPQLPRDRLGRGQPQRDLRAAGLPDGPDRLLVAERRPRARPARAGRGARAGPLRLRLDRQQGRRVLERPARVVGGRPRDRPRPPLPRVVRQPAQVRAHRAAARAPEADPGDEERHDARRPARDGLAHGGARRLRGGRGRALPPGGRDPRRNPGRAARHRLAPLEPARCRAAAASR